MQYEARNPLAGLVIRPADILVHTRTLVSPGPVVPIADDIIKASSFRKASKKLGARNAQTTADDAEKRRLADIANIVASLPNDNKPIEHQKQRAPSPI